MAEEGAAGGIDAIGAAAEVNPVEIQLEDLVLGELALDRQRQHRLLELAAKGAVVGQEDVARELLGNRRSGADPVVLDHGRSDRAADTDRVDSDMAAEAPSR